MKLLVSAAAGITLLAAAAATAQSHDHAGMQADGHAANSPAGVPGSAVIREPGQATFGAIAEVIAVLEADPATDWSTVRIDTLHSHLVDMENVFLRTRVATKPVPRGASFTVTADNRDVVASLSRMVKGHAAMISNGAGENVVVADAPGGLVVTVTGPDTKSEAKIRALGFFGLMAKGVHHRPHHLMMAQGQSMH